MDGCGRVAVPSDTVSVWMSEMELVRLFCVTAPALRAAIRAVCKSGVLKPCEVERCIKLYNGYYAEVYVDGRGTRFPHQHSQHRKGTQRPVGKDVFAKRKTNPVNCIG